MRSFCGRDILSLKDFERNEFFRVFEVAEELEPIARSRRNSDLLSYILPSSMDWTGSIVSMISMGAGRSDRVMIAGAAQLRGHGLSMSCQSPHVLQ